MKELALKATMACVAAIGLAVAMPAVANATSLYDNINYSTFMWSGTSSPGGLPVGYNDKASSFTNSGSEIYCENWNCSGRKLTWSGSANDLRSIDTGLNLGETWSDRISSIQ